MSEIHQLSITKLRDLNEMKSQYVGMVSHEMKGPLAVMHGYVTIILDEAKDLLEPDHRKYLQKTIVTVDKVVDLISALLDLTRIETGKVPMKVEDVDLGEILSESVELQTTRFKDSGITVTTELPESMPSVRT